jgi:hypothetical protein
MKRIFPELAEVVTDTDLDTICDDLRNGLYHASMLKGTVVLDPNGKAVQYSAKDKQFVINPFEFLRRVQEHFTAYTARLRVAGPNDIELISFNQFWTLRHGSTEQAANAEAFGIPHDEIVTSTAAPIDPSRSSRNM